MICPRSKHSPRRDDDRSQAISLVVTSKLAPLVKRAMPGVDVITEAGISGIESRFDFHMPLGDLVQHAIHEFVPAEHTPYLQSDAERTDKLRQSYLEYAKSRGRTRLIGLAWHTTNPEVGFTRNVSLSELQPVLSVPDVQFVSLQYGEHAEEIAECNRRNRDALFVDPYIDAFNDLDGLASQMTAMDGIVTIDNATVHLAGALGVPTILPLSTKCQTGVGGFREVAAVGIAVCTWNGRNRFQSGSRSSSECANGCWMACHEEGRISE